MSSYYSLLETATDAQKQIAALRFPGDDAAEKGIFLGCGAALKAGEFLKKRGASRVAVIADRILEKVGLLTPVLDSLKESGLAYDVFSDIAPEPHTDDLAAAEAFARALAADAVLGFGGGSSLDTAKVTACALSGAASSVDLITGKAPVSRTVPLILLPTTSGTGSEVSPYAVASHGGKKVFISSPAAIADAALVDPLMTVTMPPSVTACTGLDALTHAVEGMCGCPNPFTKALAKEATEIVFSSLPAAVAEPENLDARTKMSYASVLGMMAYTQGGGLYAHSASYIITLQKNKPHGLGCGLTLPYTLALNLAEIRDLLTGLIPAIKASGLAAPASADEVPAAFLALVKKVGVPATLAEIGYTEADVPAFGHALFADYYRAKNPKKADEADLVALAGRMLTGTI